MHTFPSRFCLVFAAAAVAVACNGNDTNIVVLEPDIVIAGDSTDTVDFGDVIVPYTADKTFQVLNAGRADLRVTDIRIEDDEDGVYTIDTTEATIAPDEGITVGLSFEPFTFDAYNHTIVIESNDPENPIYEVSLLGEGVDGPVPDIALSAQSIDFGTVAPGTTATEFVQIANTGDGPLLIDRIDQSGSGNFAIEAGPRTGGEVAGPGETSLIISYAPGADSGDSATFTIVSNDPDEPEVDLVVVGNGGSEDEYPVAVIDCPAEVNPPLTIDLDGSGSFDPNGYEPLDYEWTVLSRPLGSFSAPFNPSDPLTSLFVDLAGDWVVELRVTNSVGLTSAPATCAFFAQPQENLHVELVWDTSNSDLDLHLVQATSQFFDADGDCCFCNRNPNWGTSGSIDDPFLALDNVAGYGPENIKTQEPEFGDYFVKVHYYSDGGGGSTTATLRVWMNGDPTPFFEESKIITNKEVWDVGIVRWNADPVFIEDNADPYVTALASCQVF